MRRLPIAKLLLWRSFLTVGPPFVVMHVLAVRWPQSWLVRALVGSLLLAMLAGGAWGALRRPPQPPAGWWQRIPAVCYLPFGLGAVALVGFVVAAAYAPRSALPALAGWPADTTLAIFFFGWFPAALLKNLVELVRWIRRRRSVAGRPTTTDPASVPPPPAG
jgi:hypothetical protein